jgi:hypothetical protein
MCIRVALVWLLLALLPLRGWATLAMQLPAPASTGASSAQHVQPPCHEMASAAALAQADAETAQAPLRDGIPSHAACSMCDLCHGAAACDLQRASIAALNAVERVQPVADADTGRALVGGLERPPRRPNA